MSVASTLVSNLRRTSNGARRQVCEGWIGIDLGVEQIKLARVQRLNGSWQLQFAARLPAPYSVADAASESLELEWYREAGRILSGASADDTPMACALSMARSELRTVQLPPASEEEASAMIRQQLLDDSSRAGEREFASWRMLGTSGSKTSPIETHAVVSIATQSAHQLVDNLSSAGFECRQLDVLPLALVRAVAMAAPHQADQPQLVLDWGSEGPLLVLMNRGRADYVRVLRYCGMSRVVEVIKHGFEMTSDEVHCLLRRYGLPNGPSPDHLQRTIHELIADRLAQILAEIKTTLSYIRFAAAGLQPQRLWLMGGGALIRHVSEYFSDQLGMEVLTWSLPATSSLAVDFEMLPLFGPAAALSALGALR